MNLLSYGDLSVIVAPMQVRSVSIGIFVSVGSFNECLDNNGISHFTEHMLFKGTKTKTAFDIANEMDKLGADINAFTSKSSTCYYTVSLDTHTEKCFETLCDLYFNATVTDDNVNKERGVILEEINMTEDVPDDLAFEMCALARYSKTAYAMPILGSANNVKSFLGKDILEYISNNYTPNKTVIVFSGNVSEREVDSLIKKYYLPYKRADKSSAPCKTQYPVSDKFLYKYKPVEQSNVVIAYPSYDYNSPESEASLIVNNILGGSMSSRLFQKVREELGVVYSVYSSRSAYKDIGSLAVYFGTSPKSALKAGYAVKDVVEEIANKGISEEELEKGKEQIKTSLVLAQENTKAQMKALGTHFLMSGKLISVDEKLEAVTKVTMEDILRVSRFMMGSGDVTGSYVGPECDFKFDKIFN